MMDLHFEWKKYAGKKATHLCAVVPALGFDLYCGVSPNNGNHFYWVYPIAILSTGVDCPLPNLRWSGFSHSDAAGAVAEIEQFLRTQATEALAGRQSWFDVWRRGVAKITSLPPSMNGQCSLEQLRAQFSISAQQKGEELHALFEEMLDV